MHFYLHKPGATATLSDGKVAKESGGAMLMQWSACHHENSRCSRARCTCSYLQQVITEVSQPLLPTAVADGGCAGCINRHAAVCSAMVHAR